ncbi:hypothetical protein [Zavarzinia sp.]|uniref:hypothetical protein n=1 Tax=Zavarzinia sp. TaxID=2027920 RepID=UPI003BB6C68A
MRHFSLSLMGLLALTACAQRPSQDVYRHDEVGKSVAVSFGSVLSVREIEISGKNTGGAAVVGGAAGAIGGSQVGQGFAGPALGGLGAAVVGAAIGAVIEQAATDRKGLEYTIVLESGVAMTVVQEIADGEPKLPPGTRIIVQNSGGYQRVLSATDLPSEVVRPQGLKVVDPK